MAAPLIILGDNSPVQTASRGIALDHPVHPFVLPTLRALLKEVGTHLLQAVLFVVMPFQGKSEPPAPAHLGMTLRLLRRADELEKTDPEAAMKLRWMASTYCCV